MSNPLHWRPDTHATSGNKGRFGGPGAHNCGKCNEHAIT
jgi:hypothetical protein